MIQCYLMKLGCPKEAYVTFNWYELRTQGTKDFKHRHV